jgi:hypothetical protein
MDVPTGVFDHRCAVGKHAVSTSFGLHATKAMTFTTSGQWQAIE